MENEILDEIRKVRDEHAKRISMEHGAGSVEPGQMSDRSVGEQVAATRRKNA